MSSSSLNDIPQHLPRGKACVPCRRRKMKCDGNQPTCNQCIRFRRAEECEFSETAAPSTTRVLEQHIARLQSRIQELEIEQDDPGRVPLHNPYTNANLPTAASSPAPGQGQNWWDMPELPSRIAQTLIQYFLPHAPKLGFFLEPNRFLASLSSSSPNARPPYVLRSAVYLWGIRLSGDAQFTTHEPLFATRALRSVHDALSTAQDQQYQQQPQGTNNNALYVLQAELLLAYYFFASNRLLEGKLHAGAAVSLAYMCGLHKTLGVSAQQAYGFLPAPGGVLPLPGDAVAACERVHAWWITFVLDKSSVVALAAPSMVNEQEEGAVVDTAWPVPIEVYVQQSASGANAAVNPGRTVQRFLADVLADRESGNSYLALLAKAAALYERANHYATYADRNTPGLEAVLSGMDASIERFKQTLPPISGRDTQSHDLLMIFGLTHAATIQLHSGFMGRSATSMAKCLGAAHSIVRVAQTLGPHAMAALGGPPNGRVGVVNPVVGVVLAAAGEALVHGLRFMRSSRGQWSANPALPSEDQLVGALKTLLGVLGNLAVGSPFIESQVTKMNEALRAAL